VNDDARPNTIQYGMTEQSTLRQSQREAVLVVTGSTPLAFVGCWIRPLASGPGANAAPPARLIATRVGEKGKGEAAEVKRANRTEVNAQWI
jgi:hypothetical protein